MKKLITYIDELVFILEEFTNFENDSIKYIEKEINNFIKKKYSAIKQYKYVVLEVYNDIDIRYTIHPDFKKELEKYYPERLI